MDRQRRRVRAAGNGRGQAAQRPCGSPRWNAAARGRRVERVGGQAEVWRESSRWEADGIVLARHAHDATGPQVVSRLRQEAMAGDRLLLHGQCAPRDSAAEPFREVISQAIASLSRAASERQDAFRRGISAFSPSALDRLEALVPELAVLLGHGARVDVGREAGSLEDLRRAIGHLLRLLPRAVGPVVVVLDRLHEADSLTIGIVGDLAADPPEGMRLIGIFKSVAGAAAGAAEPLLARGRAGLGRVRRVSLSLHRRDSIKRLIRRLIGSRSPGLLGAGGPEPDARRAPLPPTDEDATPARGLRSAESTGGGDRAAGADVLELTKTIPVGIYALERDQAGKPFFSFCSPRWLEMLRLEREAVLADASLAFQRVHPEDQAGFADLSDRVMREGSPLYWRGRIVVDGETRWVTIESLPRDRPEGGPIWEGVMVDITSQVSVQEALARADAAHRAQLEQKLKTSLTASAIAHEINQPLSRLLLQAQLASLEPGVEAGPLALIIEDAKLVIGVIEKMKVLLRSVQTIQRPVDLRQVMHSSLLQVRWEAARVGCVTEARDAPRPIWTSGDATQLQLAVTNLLRNAIESVGESDPTNRRVRIALSAEPEQAAISVTDTGPGWTGAERVDGPLVTTKPGGSGLGLYIVRTIMENHGGGLELRPAPGGGAEAVLRIPLARPDETAPAGS